MKYPEYVKNCIKRLESSGFSAYAVGGAVRDSLLGLEPSDWDVTTSALPDQILTVFSDLRTIPTGIKHGTVTVLFGDGDSFSPIEITTFRIDGEYRDSRHPESVRFSSDIYDDLSRRDFTVNAMAYNENEGLIDAFNGMGDLEDRVIRAVGDPKKRFSEDALRILRAFRFSAQLGFEIEANTLDGASSCAHLLKDIARERIGAELKRLLPSRGAGYSLEKMILCGVWSEIFLCDAPDISLILALDSLKNGNFATRLAVITAHLSVEDTQEMLNSLRLSNSEKKRVMRLRSVKDFNLNSEPALDVLARRFLHLWADICDEAAEIVSFWNEGERLSDFLEALAEERAKKRPLSVSDLAIKGSDLLPLCASDHKRVGQLLSLLLDRVIEDPTVNTKEKLIEEVKKILN